MSEGRRWRTIEISVKADAVEAVESAFNSLDALGTSIDLMKRNEASLRVVGYFDELPDRAVVDEHLRDALRTYGQMPDAIDSVKESELADADWLAEWKRHWGPTAVGRFVIAPPWTELEDRGDRIVVRIEPNMAFGTGTHETTRLCLRAVDAYFKPGMSFLDIGTGTGILAIAAAKLGGPAAKITAFDIDPDAVSIARANAALNGVGQTIEFFTGTIDESTPAADLVCANLTLNAIRPLLGSLISKARVALVLSGILAGQEDEALACLTEAGPRDPIVSREGEWISIAVKS